MAEQPLLKDSYDEQAEIYRAELAQLNASPTADAHINAPMVPDDDDITMANTSDSSKLMISDSRASVAPSLTDTSVITASGVATPRDPVLKIMVGKANGKRKIDDLGAALDDELRSVKLKINSKGKRFSF
jgi:hypothetical protein